MSGTRETRTIRTGSQLIYHTIYSQAGSLEKALAELATNSIDAGASHAALSLSAEGFCFTDDGAGFRSREEIETFFEQLAFEHVEGDRRHGRFGLGRAQAWAFASTKWRTGEFEMDVDVKHKGLDYELASGLAPIKGCKIDGKLYEPLLPSDLERVRRGFAELVAYVDIPITINGELVNKDPEKQKWDLVTDEAYIRLRETGDLLVYSQGILTKKFSGWSFGTGGVVVTKQALALNVARNDILLSKCKVWPKIRAHLDGKGAEKTRSNRKLKDHERKFLAARLMGGSETFENAQDIKFLPEINGSLTSLAKLSRIQKFTVAPESGSRVAERLHQLRTVHVFDPSVLEMFGCESGDELAEEIRGISRMGHGGFSRGPGIRLEHIPFETLSGLVSDTHEVLNAKDLRPKEKAALSALGFINSSVSYNLMKHATTGVSRKPRTLMAGVSDVADGWTDGATMIAINREMLKQADRGVAGFSVLVNLLAHEYLHDSSDVGSHQHDHDFYQAYHDLTFVQGAYSLGSLAVKAAERYVRILGKEGLKLGHHLIKDADRAVMAERNTEPGFQL